MNRAQRDSVAFLRSGAGQTFPGVYRGKVEAIDDPDRLGRVRVRIWALHGGTQHTALSSLPWAEIAEQGGGGYDYGSFNPPPVGSAVFVMFENGQPMYPVVVGTFRGVPKRDEYNPNVFLVEGGQPPMESPWTPPDEALETPKDVFEDVYGGDPHPTRRVWQKSYKGHTIIVEDGDGKEFLKIIDRSGQVIEMDCAVQTEYGKGNAAQRGIRDATRGDQLSGDVMVDNHAHIRLKGLSGHEIMLDSSAGDEKVIILSRNREGSVENKIVMNSSASKSGIEISDSKGDKILMNPDSPTPIVIQDSAGSAIEFNRNDGVVTVKSAKRSVEQAAQKYSVIEGTDEKRVYGDKVTSIQGNRKTSIAGSSSLSTMGDDSRSVGGRYQMMLTATAPLVPGGPPLPLLPTDTAWETQTTTGGLKLVTYSGDVLIGQVLPVVGSPLNYVSAGLTGVEIASLLPIRLGGLAAVNPVLNSTPFIAALTGWINALLTCLGTASPPISGLSIFQGFTQTFLNTTIPACLSAKILTI